MNQKRTCLLFFAIFMFAISHLNAQKPPIKFGKVSMDEMNMTVYDKDTTAEAVVIADYGVSDIVYTPNLGFELHFNTHVRIKILKKDGLDKADVVVRLQQSTGGSDEEFGGLKAQTYNLVDGKIEETRLSKKDVYNEEESKYWKLVKFALPNVKVGSVIEYEYTIRSPFLYNFQSWYFQSDIPTIWSEYRTLIPEYFDYKQVFGGYIRPTSSESKTYAGTLTGTSISFSNNFQRWIYQDVPAFKDEKYITTARDYLAKVEFELNTTKMPGRMIETFSTSWNEIVNDLMSADYFGAALNRDGIVKELTEKINPDDAPEKKMVAAYYLVKNHMKWNERYTIYVENTLRSAFNKNEGNIAEINLLLVNLLRSVGIDAHPVLISTRGHSKINSFYPRISSFNSVIAMAKINGKNILLDATIAYLTPGELPYNCLNDKGLVAIKGNSYWIPLLSNEQIYTSTMVMAKITEDKFEAQIAKAYKSATATVMRNRIAKDGKEKFIEEYKKKNSDWEIADYVINNETDATKPLNEKITVESIGTIDVSGDMIYLPAILTEEQEENPFSSETREYPVDFAMPIFDKYIINIAIPEGYEVEELPQAAKVVLPDNAASFVYQAQLVGNNIQIISQRKIDKTLFLPQEYHLLRELYRHIIAKYGEQIVLKRI